MKALLSLVLLFMTIFTSTAQVVITNKNFSIGSTGRIGVGFSPNGEGNTGKSLNLSGQGSIGGRMEQTDYMDLLPALHFTPVFSGKDSTSIFFQARIGVYSANGQFLGNISSRSTDGLTFILPETFIEAKNIMGSPWSAWAGARYRRYDDIHINDYFYFDDHSSQGFGVSYKKTEFTMLFPASTDSSATNSYIYTISMNGARTKAFRQRLVFIGEHSIVLNNGEIIKLLAEFHHLSATSKNAIPTYSADYGWVAGIKYSTPLKTFKKGSFNQLSVRYGKGIANGGDNGNTQTWQTYGAPDAQTGKYTNAYSFTAVEHVLLNLTNRFSINGYSIYTKSKGGSDQPDKDKDFSGKLIFNAKTDFAIGFRSFVYFTNWFHLLNEVHYAIRKDGTQPDAAMLKLSIAPTLVPVGKRDPWSRPHIRMVFSVAHYNSFARNNQYSAFLQTSNKQWGTYFGVKSEWWIF